MSNNIDMNSKEFKDTYEKTVKFTDKVINQFNWVYNPQDEIVEGIKLGLTRNKIMFNKRFCPCFMVEEREGKPQSVEDRICPCKPAIEKEIPEDGVCHCQIFCTQEYADKVASQEKVEEKAHDHTEGLTGKECETLLKNNKIDSEELEELLKARKAKNTDFILIDVREPMENRHRRISGTDLLIPTSNFYIALEEANLDMDKELIIYCQLGSRSNYIQQVLKDRNYKVTDLEHGISAWHGDTENGTFFSSK